MTRYFRLLASFIRYGVVASLEFRVNFIGWSVVSLIYALMFILTTELVFGQVNSIAGWTKGDALLVSSSVVLFTGLMWFFVFPNLTAFSELIRKGGLDFYLLKPVNSRFLVSMKIFEYDQALRIIAVSVVMINLVMQSGHEISFLSVLGFAFLFMCGMIIFYNIFFALTITNFWLINVHNFEDIFHELIDPGRYPVQVYKGALWIVFVYLLPVGFVGTFPVQALFGRLEIGYYFLAVFVAVITFVFSQWFWNFALKRYSSASS